jgi:hypothetical protein
MSLRGSQRTSADEAISLMGLPRPSGARNDKKRL